jgi:prophage antirepressor-like protein
MIPKTDVPLAGATAEPRLHHININDISIPTVEVDGRFWLSASPLCRALGLKMNSRHRAGRHIARLPEGMKDYRFMPVRGVLQRCAVVTGEGAVLLAATGRRDGDGAFRAELKSALNGTVSGAAA